MAKRKQKDNPLDYISLPGISISSEVKRGISIILLLAFGAISLLSLFSLAGVVGEYLAQGYTLVFGWDKWLAPLLILSLVFILYRGEKSRVRGANYLGLFLLVICIQTLLHIFLNEATWSSTVETGAGGGYLGLFFVSMFVNLLGFWGGLIAVTCLFLVSLMLTFNTTLSSVIGPDSWFAKTIHFINSLFVKIFKREATVIGNEPEEVEELEPMTAIDEEDTINFKTSAVDGEAAVPEFMKTFKKAAAKVIKEKESVPKPTNIKIDVPLDLLSSKMGKPTSGDIKNNTIVIKNTLENFGIKVEMGDVNVGPTVTQYTFKPAEGIKVSRITTLSNDLALSLAAHPIRIEAPIPGKSLIGVEVPNHTKATVYLREVFASTDFTERKNNMMIALGKDVGGRSWLYDLTKMPHLLVAGATNSGKSVCLNGIIISLLYQNNPDDLKMIMVDPKRVELPVYNNIPHLLTPVITEVSKTINALKWCLNEMDRRFEILSKAGKRNIASYNENLQPGDEKMPYLVFVIDELADLMVTAARDIEGSIIRLAQMARAVGIHLILATQRPSVDVITGLIKANMPARIAFSVASGIDSRTILDNLGAEKLLGQGDMLFTCAEISKPKRLQGAFVSDQEIKKVVNYIKEHGGEAQYLEGITERQKVKGIAGVGLDGASSDDDDELLSEAKEIVINTGKASASYLQRRLSIGYARAARLLDLLEELGIIGPSNGAKPRDIMITKEQYESMNADVISGVSLHNREEAVAPDSYLPAESLVDEDEDGESAEVEVFKPEMLEDVEVDDNEAAVEIKEDLATEVEGSELDEADVEVEMENKESITSEPTEKLDTFDEDEDEGKYFAK